MDLTQRKAEIDRQKQGRQQDFQRLLQGNFGAVENVDQLFKLTENLSSEETKKLLEGNASYRAKYDEFNRIKTPEELEIEKSESEARAAAQAEADRIAAEEATQAALPADGETLFEGVEKIGPGQYKLTVDPGDGSNPEVFYGSTQGELFAKLRKSKAHATKEIRRRSNKIRITDELKNLKGVEVVNYPPLIQPLQLTPSEIFSWTEKQKDPVHVLEATRVLRHASLSEDECNRLNQAELDRRYREGYRVATEWVKSHPEFYECRENLLAMQELTNTLDWALTPSNVSLAFKTLTDQGVLLDRPGTEPTDAPVLEVPSVPVASAPAPVVPRLRPASSTGAMPTRRSDAAFNRAPKKFTLTPEEYHKTPTAELRARYNRDAAYREAVDALIASGKV